MSPTGSKDSGEGRGESFLRTQMSREGFLEAGLNSILKEGVKANCNIKGPQRTVLASETNFKVRGFPKLSVLRSH